MAEGDTTNQLPGVVIGTPVPVQNTQNPVVPVQDTNPQVVPQVDPNVPLTPIDPVVPTPMPEPVNVAPETMNISAEPVSVIESPVENIVQPVVQPEIPVMPVETAQTMSVTPEVAPMPAQEAVISQQSALPEIMTPIPTPPTHSTTLSVGNAMEGDMDPMDVPQTPAQIVDEVQSPIEPQLQAPNREMQVVPTQEVTQQPVETMQVEPLPVNDSMIAAAPIPDPIPVTQPIESPVPIQPIGDTTPVMTPQVQEIPVVPMVTTQMDHGKPIVNDQGFLVGEEGNSQKKNLN